MRPAVFVSLSGFFLPVPSALEPFLERLDGIDGVLSLLATGALDHPVGLVRVWVGFGRIEVQALLVAEPCQGRTDDAQGLSSAGGRLENANVAVVNAAVQGVHQLQLDVVGGIEGK
jgi:hypothetical protein